MENKGLIQKCAGLPVPLLPCMVGAVTLSNIYANISGFGVIRHITTISAIIVWFFALIKICVHFKVFKNEYKNTVPASLYAGFTMIMMLVSAYLYNLFPLFSKALWLTAIALHAIHILVFVYLNVIKGVKIDTFVPSWFVTANGIMVSIVIGEPMNEPVIKFILLCYGIGVYFILAPLTIARLCKKPINAPLLHTKAILLAPASLCLVSYLNVIKEPNATFTYFLYLCVILSFLYIIINMIKFFSVPFSPGFAGLTFPNAIGIVASLRMSAYFDSVGNVFMSKAIREIAGIQIYITTAIIAFVLYNFLIMFIKSYNKKEADA